MYIHCVCAEAVCQLECIYVWMDASMFFVVVTFVPFLCSKVGRRDR